jgi:hypothetical protein
MWAEAVVKRTRFDAGLLAMRKLEDPFKPVSMARRVRQRGLPLRALDAEGHLFINCAHQLMQYRKWVGRLGILAMTFFVESTNSAKL